MIPYKLQGLVFLVKISKFLLKPLACDRAVKLVIGYVCLILFSPLRVSQPPGELLCTPLVTMVDTFFMIFASILQTTILHNLGQISEKIPQILISTISLM